jgi:hypothetical protein
MGCGEQGSPGASEIYREQQQQVPPLRAHKNGRASVGMTDLSLSIPLKPADGLNGAPGVCSEQSCANLRPAEAEYLSMATIAIEQEMNPWEAQAARFDFAARKLNLEDDLWKVLRSPSREITSNCLQDSECITRWREGRQRGEFAMLLT